MCQKRPVIALTGTGKKVQTAFGIHSHLAVADSYLTMLAAAGGTPIIIPPQIEANANLFGQFDGFLLTGGHDVDPERYTESREPNTGEPDASRDTLEMGIARYAIQHDRPLLAICRGIQILNVALGGSLIQDIGTHDQDLEEHWVPHRWNEVVHEVNLRKNSLARSILGPMVGTNSMHHQALRRLGTDLQTVGTSQDGLIEAAEHRLASFVLGVQWHPECLGDLPAGRRLFGALVQACAQRS